MIMAVLFACVGTRIGGNADILAFYSEFWFLGHVSGTLGRGIGNEEGKCGVCRSQSMCDCTIIYTCRVGDALRVKQICILGRDESA